ncbi:MAG: hypothetical protein FWG91_01325 [Lachnospiraceae bacterium]|nr:hypothetical protein [Lachnospiraceae bacterium]
MKKIGIKPNSETNNSKDADFQFIYKDQSWPMKIIGKLFKHFYEMVPTLIGQTIYLPTKWDLFSDSVKEIILLHEQAHMNQQKKYGWLTYMVFTTLFFPMLFCPFRLYWEKEAWEETIRKKAVQCRSLLLEDEGFQWFVSQKSLFYTVRSGWMWNNKEEVHAWLCNTIQKEMWQYKQLSRQDIETKIRLFRH